jgi:membrane-bound lytic murein transglycosylase A
MRYAAAAWISGISLAACALLSGCATVPPEKAPVAPVAPTLPPPEKVGYNPVSFTALQGWQDNDPTPAFTAFKRSCLKISTLPADQGFGPAALATPVSDWQAACAAAAGIDASNIAAVRQYFEQNFRPLAVTFGDNQNGLFTGYYEPEIRASLTCGGAYKSPLYGRPSDMITANLGLFRSDLKDQQIVGKVNGGKLIPYDSREAINKGVLSGKARVIACAADPVESFFLEIQGSGRLLLEDGQIVQIGYDGKNGRPYVAIGRELVRLGELKIEDVTLQSIKAWLAAHPDQAQAILDLNPSYVFFRRIFGDYAIGAEGVELTPGHSLAVDRSFLPLGAPVWLETDLPVIDTPQSGQPFHRLMVAQDTGGAITGAVRGDIFWGAGSEAERLAGAMKQTGRYFILVPRAASVATR